MAASKVNLVQGDPRKWRVHSVKVSCPPPWVHSVTTQLPLHEVAGSEGIIRVQAPFSISDCSEVQSMGSLKVRDPQTPKSSKDTEAARNAHRVKSAAFKVHCTTKAD